MLTAFSSDNVVDPHRTTKNIVIKAGTAIGKTILSQLIVLCMWNWLNNAGEEPTVGVVYATNYLFERDSLKME